MPQYFSKNVILAKHVAFIVENFRVGYEISRETIRLSNECRRFGLRSTEHLTFVRQTNIILY